MLLDQGQKTDQLERASGFRVSGSRLASDGSRYFEKYSWPFDSESTSDQVLSVVRLASDRPEEHFNEIWISTTTRHHCHDKLSAT